MVVNNLKFYLAWAIPYFIFNFVIFGDFIKRNNYNSLFGYFETMKWSKNIFDSVGPWLEKPVFMGFHFVFYFVSNLLGIASFYNFYFGHVIGFIFTTIAVQRGAKFYIKGISSRLDLQL